MQKGTKRAATLATMSQVEKYGRHCCSKFTCWSKICPLGRFLGPSLSIQLVQNHSFEYSLARGPYKNALWKRGRKKHENLMKNPRARSRLEAKVIINNDFYI